MDSMGILFVISIIILIVIFIGIFIKLKKYFHQEACKRGVHNRLIEEFKVMTPKLADNFGSIWLITNDKSPNPARAFHIIDKIILYSANPLIISWWKEFMKGNNEWNQMVYKKKAEDLLKLMIQSGLTRGERHNVAPENFDQ